MPLPRTNCPIIEVVNGGPELILTEVIVPTVVVVAALPIDDCCPPVTELTIIWSSTMSWLIDAISVADTAVPPADGTVIAISDDDALVPTVWVATAYPA